MGRRELPQAAAMIAALALALTACGGSGDDGALPTDSTAGGASDDADVPTTDASVADSIDGVVGETVTEAADNTGTSTAEGDGTGDVLDPFLGDLPQPCTLISADEIAAVIGAAVTADDTFSTDCFYEPADVAAGGLTIHTSTLALGDECSEFIQTEPFVPQESVEPAPEYGDLAALVTTDGTSQYQVCADGVAFSVSVLGLFESDDELRALAAETLDLLMERS